MFVKVPAGQGYSELVTRGKSLKANIKRVSSVTENLTGFPFDRNLVHLELPRSYNFAGYTDNAA